jgi:hypothetical protein
VVEGATFEKCWVGHSMCTRVIGIGSVKNLPDCFDASSDFGSFTEAVNVARISELQLSGPQKTLIAILHKLFFQPGRGRQEEALLRGGARYWHERSADEIMRYLISNRLVSRVQGRQGHLVVPERRHTKRVARIMELMSNSDDDLWMLVSRYR